MHAYLATGHAPNQRLVFSQLSLLYPRLDTMPHAVMTTMLAVFSANRSLCVAAPPQLFASLLAAHHAERQIFTANELHTPRGPTPAALSPATTAATAALRLRLLLELICPARWPLHRSQLLVMSFLEDSSPSLATDPTDGEYERRRAAVAAAQVASQGSTRTTYYVLHTYYTRTTYYVLHTTYYTRTTYNVLHTTYYILCTTYC